MLSLPSPASRSSATYFAGKAFLASLSDSFPWHRVSLKHFTAWFSSILPPFSNSSASDPDDNRIRRAGFALKIIPCFGKREGRPKSFAQPSKKNDVCSKESCLLISHIVHDDNVRFSESLAVKSESTQRNAFLEGGRHFWIDGKAWSSQANVFQLLSLKIDANWNGGAKLGDTARPIWKAEGLAWTSSFFFELITTL